MDEGSFFEYGYPNIANEEPTTGYPFFIELPLYL